MLKTAELLRLNPVDQLSEVFRQGIEEKRIRLRLPLLDPATPQITEEK